MGGGETPHNHSGKRNICNCEPPHAREYYVRRYKHHYYHVHPYSCSPTPAGIPHQILALGLVLSLRLSFMGGEPPHFFNSWYGI